MNFSQAEINSLDNIFNPINIIPGVSITPKLLVMPEVDNTKAVTINNTNIMLENAAKGKESWIPFFKSLYKTNKFTFMHTVTDDNVSVFLDESDTVQSLCIDSIADRVGFIGISIENAIKAIPENVLSDTISMVAGAFKHISNRNVASQVATNIVVHAIYLFVKESAITDIRVANTRYVLDNRLQYFVYPMIRFIFNTDKSHA